MRERAARWTTGVPGPTRAAVYRLARSGPLGKKRCKSAEQAGERPDGQPDDVEVVAVDPANEGAAASLDRVTARASAPFAGGQVPVQDRVAEVVERHARHLRRRPVADHHAADHLVRA